MNRDQPDTHANESDLVRRAQRGDAAAVAQLVSRYQDRVFNTCVRLCGNQADALDLAQTTFLRALEALPEFRAGSGFFTWLYRIAVNQFIARRRGERRRSDLLAEHIRNDARRRLTESPGADPVEAAQQRELVARVQRALLQLDEEFRIAVVLRDVDGLDYDEIAEVTQTPIGTVKSRIHRGRSMLREIIAAESGRTIGRASV
ncbi:MAG: sigma-70 family RNA polymerase sigma factor [Phycisphaerales bacterium]|nr:sigma-70 family RNA polymerase sigma factor [Phycisphaerales bacterium]